MSSQIVAKGEPKMKKTLKEQFEFLLFMFVMTLFNSFVISCFFDVNIRETLGITWVTLVHIALAVLLFKES